MEAREGLSIFLGGPIINNGNAPFRKELGAVEGLADDASALRGRVGPGGPHDLLHLRQDAAKVVAVSRHHRQVAHPLV